MSVLAGMPPGTRIPAKVLAEFHGVPREYLSKCMQALSTAGLVSTTLGPKGGYSLAKAPMNITFLEIVEAIEGKKKTFHCSEIRRNNPCIPKKSGVYSKVCGIASVMYEADEAWRHVLKQKKLSGLVNEVEQSVGRENLKKTGEWFQQAVAKN
jgi:Rrf2 family protein